MINLIKIDKPKVGENCFYRYDNDKLVFCRVIRVTEDNLYEWINLFTGEEDSGLSDFWAVREGTEKVVDEQQKKICDVQERICQLAHEEEKRAADKLKNLERWAQEKRTSWKRDCVSAMCGNQVTNASFCGFAVAAFDEMLTCIKRERRNEDMEEEYEDDCGWE